MRVSSLLWLLALSLSLTIGYAQQGNPPPDQGGAGGAGGARGGGRGGGRGNFDPAQFQERMLQHFKEQLGSTDEEWTALKPLVQAVFDAQRQLREYESAGTAFGGRGGAGRQTEKRAEVAALEKALEAKDANAVKTAVEALRKAKTEAKAKVTQAQTALREVLTAEQEARLVLQGFLD